jgi:hypothetical protein
MPQISIGKLASRPAWPVACVLAAVLAAPLLRAQSDTDGSLAAFRACERIADDAARLDCLDDALAGSARPPAPAPAPAATASPVQVPAPAAQPSADPPAAPPAAAAATPTRAAPPPPPSERTQQQQAASDRDNGIVRIVELRRSGVGQVSFVTDDGRVLVQTGGATGRFPDAPFDAQLESGMRNTYFLTSPLGGPRIRVAERP